MENDQALLICNSLRNEFDNLDDTSFLYPENVQDILNALQKLNELTNNDLFSSFYNEIKTDSK